METTTADRPTTTGSDDASDDETRLDRAGETAADDDTNPSGIGARVDRFQKRHLPLGFAYAVVKKYGEDGGGRLGAVIAYYGFFSVFPALLLLVSITGFVLDGNPDLRDDIVDSALGSFPVIGDGLADRSLGGSGFALAVGLAGALWAGLGALVATQNALDEIWDVPLHDRPDVVSARLRGLLMLVVLGGGLVGGTVLSNLVTQLSLPGIGRVGLVAGALALNIAMAWLAFQILTRKTIGWMSLLPGAVVAGIGAFVLQNLGSVLVDRYVTGASDTYGVFAVVIGLLAWFHLFAQVTLLAAEINVVRSRRLYPRTLFGDELTDADRRAYRGLQRAAAGHEAFEPDAEV